MTPVNARMGSRSMLARRILQLALVSLLVAGCGRVPGTGAATSPSAPQSPSATLSATGTATPSPGGQTCPNSLKPSPRELATAVYDAKTGQLMVFGGYAASDSGAVFGDTWSWQSGCWSAIQTTNAPSAREEMAIAYFPPSGISVAYGGRTGVTQSTDSNEAWTWDGVAWKVLPAKLPVLHSPLMAFDGQTHVVLYGYADGGTSETWLWDGISWTQQQVSPPARSQATLALDPSAGRAILFGGLGLEKMNLLSDTWAWDGSRWSQLSPTHTPTPRLGAAMSSFASRKEVVLVGGFSRATILGDVWVWTGNDWSPASDFQPRTFGTAVDTGTQVLLFGGTDGSADSNDVFGWDGSTWGRT